MSMKNPLIPAGIEPATFRFVAQHLNHCATAVPEVAGREGKMRTEKEAKNTTRGIVRIKIIKFLQKEKRGKARKREYYEREAKNKKAGKGKLEALVHHFN